ncbi:tetratricopeptide repeat protein [Kaarinaea lacus]
MSRISVVELFILSLVFLVVYSSSSNAATNQSSPLDIVTGCDRLAAHPSDPNKITEGVGWDQIDVIAAMDACSEEISRQPMNARIQYQYARVLDKQELYKEAVIWYRKSAEQGYPAAQNSLGYAYEWGQGLETNLQLAVQWYRQAADQNLAQAQNNLGTMYYIGKGVDYDDKQALYWYQKAAEQGHATAQRNVGVMYSKGSGVKQNYETAFQWYLKAASQDNPHAQYNVGMSYFYGKGVESDQEQAKAWFEKAAKNGNYQAAEALHQIEFKQDYCNSLKNSTTGNLDSGKLISKKIAVSSICN